MQDLPDSDELAAIRVGLRTTEALMIRERFRGYDPYDALTSPLFSLPGLRSSALARLAGQQILRRLPINIRPLLGIEKGYNPVTLGLALQGYSDLALDQPDRLEEIRSRARDLVEELGTLRSDDFSGSCWGYDFPWQSSGTLFPAFTPTVVATALVTNGLFAAYEHLRMSEALELCESASAFVRHDLKRAQDADGSFCWSYSPFDNQTVLNANAKGARLLAQVYSVTREDELRESAANALRFVVKHQRPNGSWPYAVGDSRDWSDGFHTGYVLDALHEYEFRTGDDRFVSAMHLGWQYYRDHFFDKSDLPRYYDYQLYPLDSTNFAQALLTLVRFGEPMTARRLALWALEHLQRPDGAFVYRRYRRFTNRIPYMRWSTAWMFCGLSSVAAANALTARAEQHSSPS